MIMKKTLLASAIAIAFGMAGQTGRSDANTNNAVWQTITIRRRQPDQSRQHRRAANGVRTTVTKDANNSSVTRINNNKVRTTPDQMVLLVTAALRPQTDEASRSCRELRPLQKE
jgi:hypothetical protein